MGFVIKSVMLTDENPHPYYIRAPEDHTYNKVVRGISKDMHLPPLASADLRKNKKIIIQSPTSLEKVYIEILDAMPEAVVVADEPGVDPASMVQF